LKKELSLIARGAGFYLVGFGVSKVLAYLYRALLARTLGPTEYGIFSIGVGIMGIALVFAAIGLYQGIMHFVSIYDSTGKRERARGTILFSLKLQLLTSSIIAAILFFSADFIALTFFREPSLGLVLKIFSLTLPCLVLTSSLMIVAVAFKKLEYKILVRNLLENVAKISFTGLLLFAGFHLFGAAVGLALSNVFAFIVALYIIQKKVFPLFGKGLKSRSNARELFSYSWPLLAVGFFEILMNSIDNVMLGSLSQAFDVGIYNVARPTANLLIIAPFAFGSLFLPIITGLYAQKRLDEFKKMFKVVTRWIFAGIFPCLLFTLLFSEEILSVMFGSVYAQGAATLAILAIGIFMVSFVGPVRSILESIKRTKLIFVNTVIASLVNVGLNLWLIPLFAASGNAVVGAALATAASYFLWNLLALAEVFFLTRLHPYGKAYAIPTISACLSIAIFYLVKKRLPYIPSLAFPFDFLILAALGISFLAIYALLFLVLRGLQPEDITVLKAVEKKYSLRLGFVKTFIKRFG
jgi:O-antigen/teichoic acid export membrane protein